MSPGWYYYKPCLQPVLQVVVRPPKFTCHNRYKNRRGVGLMKTHTPLDEVEVVWEILTKRSED